MPDKVRRILVVDDEEPFRFAVNDYFSARGYEIDCAEEMEEAEAMLSMNDYDVVIVDLRLGGIFTAEGFEIIKNVRHQRPRIRTILFTAYGSPDVETEALSRGADSFLQKPQPLSELVRVVEELTGVAA